MQPKLDHCVIHVSDWARSDAFYGGVLEGELVDRGGGTWAYRFGAEQLNVHGPGVKPHPVARNPVARLVSSRLVSRSARLGQAFGPRRSASSNHPMSVGCRRTGQMAFDLVIDIENTPGTLAQVAAAISDAGVNIAAATCIGSAERAELHILVPHAEAAKHSLAISHLGVTREREVVVVDVEDRPGVLADLTRTIAQAGIDLDLVYVATRNRVVFGAADLAALRAVLDAPS
jgi:hypothetical protein